MKDHLVRNVLIVSIILIGVAISIGFSFAYFTAKIVGNEDAELMKVTSGTMELTFVDNNGITLEKAKPGDKKYKTFSVENTGTLDDNYNYNIKLVVTKNTFVKRDLKYILEECSDITCNTIKEDGIKEEGYINTDSTKNGEMYLAVGIPRPEQKQIQYYKLTIDFQELNMNQNDNKEATFNGKVNVDAEEEAELYVQEANAPELYQGMIPVYFKEGNIYIADPDKDDWYNYENNEWGNAVLINYADEATRNKFYEGDKLKVDTQVQEEDILQMYVWIPRYRYKLFNVGLNGTPKQIIEIEFEKGTETTGNVSCKYIDMFNGTVKEECKNAENGNWYTHPAFTFGETELKGFWVGKFEPSDPGDSTGRNVNNIGEITILPNKTSMVSKSVSTIFNAERDIENKNATKYNLNSNEIDTRVMKNIEWGAVAYLTQSVYGIYKDEKTCNISDMGFDECEVWINNTAQGTGTDGTYSYGGTYTGCVANSVSEGPKWNLDNTDGTQPAECDEENRWNTGGVKASTTGNMYGVYDMSGGAWEYVMGVTKTQDGNDIYYASSGFAKATMPDSKYYDLYDFSTSNTTHERGHLGDSTRETLKTFGNLTGSWNSNYAYFPSVPSEGTWPWFLRGGGYNHTTAAGVFAFHWNGGGTNGTISFRSVLSAA